jgi:hypothetical protein
MRICSRHNPQRDQHALQMTAQIFRVRNAWCLDWGQDYETYYQSARDARIWAAAVGLRLKRAKHRDR